MTSRSCMAPEDALHDAQLAPVRVDLLAAVLGEDHVVVHSDRVLQVLVGTDGQDHLGAGLLLGRVGEPDDAIAGSKRGGAICAPRPRLTTQLVRLGSRRGQTPSSTAMVSNGSGSMAKPQSSRRTSSR